MSVERVIKLWQFLPNGHEYLLKFLKFEVSKNEAHNGLNFKYGKYVEFGKRLEKLFRLNQNTYPSNFIRKMKVSKTYGILVATRQKLSLVKARCVKLGWNSPKIFSTVLHKHVDIFELLMIYDVVVVRDGIIPLGFEVYVCSSSEMQILKKGGVILQNSDVRLLTERVRTNIDDVNVFNQLDLTLRIIGVGTSKFSKFGWYMALENYATDKLFDLDGGLNLSVFDRFVEQVGCCIPGCVGEKSKAIYWHNHLDDNHPSQSLQNVKFISNGRIGIDCGSALKLNLKYDNGRVRNVIVTKDIYERFCTKELLSKYGSVIYYFVQSYSIECLPLLLNEVISIDFECYVHPPQSMCVNKIRELRYQCETKVLVLTCVGNKGSLKSTFVRFLEEISNHIYIVDSDEFGIYLANELFGKSGFEFVYREDISIFDQYLDSLLSEGDKDLCELRIEDLDNLRISVEYDKYYRFYRDGYDNGFKLAKGFNDYIFSKCESLCSGWICLVFCHSHFEARLVMSHLTVLISSGIKVNEDNAFRRVLGKSGRLSHYLRELIQLRVNESSFIGIANVLGYGDLIRAIM